MLHQWAIIGTKPTTIARLARDACKVATYLRGGLPRALRYWRSCPDCGAAPGRALGFVRQQAGQQRGEEHWDPEDRLRTRVRVDHYSSEEAQPLKQAYVVADRPPGAAARVHQLGRRADTRP
nr:hypothetical protein GCM10020063_010360 [Dactylosporangium thailandense]